jgi:hypothetical protein
MVLDPRARRVNTAYPTITAKEAAGTTKEIAAVEGRLLAWCRRLNVPARTCPRTGARVRARP